MVKKSPNLQPETSMVFGSLLPIFWVAIVVVGMNEYAAVKLGII